MKKRKLWVGKPGETFTKHPDSETVIVVRLDDKDLRHGLVKLKKLCLSISRACDVYLK